MIDIPRFSMIVSSYIAFYWRSAIEFTAVFGSGVVLSKEVTNGGPDAIRDLNGCIAQGVIQLLNDPTVRAYLSTDPEIATNVSLDRPLENR